MTPQQIKDVKEIVVAIIGNRIILPEGLWWLICLSIIFLVTPLILCVLWYFRKKGEHLAMKEDLGHLTKLVEEIKTSHLRQIEEYKMTLARREKAAEVADFLTEWIKKENADLTKLNNYAMRLGLWLPSDLYRTLANCITWKQAGPNTMDVLIGIRKHLLKEDAGDLMPGELIHFPTESIFHHTGHRVPDT